MKISIKYEKKIGIYCIHNIVNNKKYVGSSINIRTRLQKHRSALRGGYHNNLYLQNSWNKHGEIYFDCYVIEYCLEEELLTKEEYYVNLFGDYNITKEIMRNSPSPESIKKHSETKKYLHSINALPRTFKAITQYSLKGEFIKDWQSITEASKELNIHVTTIIRCLDKTFKQGKGYLWTYKGQIAPEPYVKKSKEILVNSRSRIIRFTSNDEVLEFPSIKSACLYFKKSHPNIYQYYTKGMLFMKKYKIDLIKSDKLLENPEEGNQQPIISLND